MKKKIIFITSFFAAVFYNSQVTNTENYVQERTYLEPVEISNPDAKQINTVQYFDGLGRAKQIVNTKSSSLGNDVVTHFEYNEYGKQTKSYLPVPQAGSKNGGYYETPLNNASSIYGSEKIYAEKLSDYSPLNRPSQDIRVGNDWAFKPVFYTYSVNKDGEIKKYTATFNYATFQSSISLGGTYGNNQLYKNVIIDEDNNQTIEFKNGEGQLILLRKVLSPSENADTYYVYNDYNQLAFVIPPLASKTSQVDAEILDNLCYQYKYDNRNRLVEKKIPGNAWEYMVYDRQNRLVLTQDAILGSTNNNFAKKGWLFTKYDQFGRIVYTGFFANTATRAAMQTAINSMNANIGNNETRSSTPFAANGLDIFYTKSAFPTGSMTVLSVNYYDTYPPLPVGVTLPPYIINQEQAVLKDALGSRSTKSLPVASYIKNIDDDNWTKNYTWYDLKGRVIGSHSINYLGGYTKKELLLNFAGSNRETYTYHKRTPNDIEVKIKEVFEYDNQNRLISHKHRVNNHIEEPVAIFSYNELGQLKNKKIGKDYNDFSNPLQSIDYKYNIRGWLTDINDPDNLGTDFFALRLKYQSPQDSQYGIAKFNGNISEVDWKTSSDGIQRRYAYNYDSLNRLLKGTFLTPNLSSQSQNHFYDEEITYDLNGNIKTLNRFQAPPLGSSTALQIDELVYDYEISNKSNKLIKITDNRNNTSGYPIGGNIISYDLNGNITSQKDKGITNIIYNYLSLPKEIVATQGNTKYFYNSSGVKLRKTFETKTTDYLEGFQYENGVLKFIPTGEGMYNFERSEYMYDYKDQLGNVRLTFVASDGGGTIILKENNYYPFGLLHQGYNGFDNLRDFDIPYKDKYNGKELQETGMYDYGARFYMPDLGRWGATDPLSELQFADSSYSYVFGNPIKFNDPTGMFGEDPPTKGYSANNPIDVGEIVLTGNRNSSLSFMGIQSLSAYHSSQDRLAAGIRASRAALATEKFEKNLAFAIGTFGMGGSNLVASAGWATFDTWLSYQEESLQDKAAQVQMAALVLVVVRKGNGIQNLLVTPDASRINLANGITRSTPLRMGSGELISAGWQHVVEGHFNRALGGTRSIFSITEDNLKSVLQSKTVVDAPITALTGGQFVRTVDTGTIVGNVGLTHGGGPTSWIKVITDYKGNLITTYPVTPPVIP
ncbi:RHS repeat-associated core domain-containing protein [Chryseobacterium oleae]|uniref:RHS repeat-associated core domain-containing protein n=1 Tax=Chryseobacterium oleae TaxID=491207 RepID=A0A1I4YXD8_CHROL|nr:DUF6443 domain-containing protein [Chryseobacterium oleae]SFN42433.1 RHS repeat-associated core domain-containing protein [Chryseobacterium oleae]